MNVFIVSVLAAIAVLFPKCNVVQETRNPPGPNVPRDPVVVVGQCEAACKRMAELKCEGWQGSPGYDGEYGTGDDVACVEVCGSIDINPESDLNTKCVAAAKSCRDVGGCY